MGIRGIVSLIRSKNLLLDYPLHDCTILIDGSLLAHDIYIRNSTTNHMFGGEYDLFIDYVTEFFLKLQKCNIEPVVVVDGSLNPTMEKISTKLSRMQRHLEKSRQICDGNFSDNLIYPVVATSVFCAVLKKLGIRLYRTAHESEYVICQIARDLHCPILSSDGDFFIENLPAGVLHLQDLMDHLKICNGENQGKPYQYLKCKMFNLKHFKNIFPGPCNLSMLAIAVPIMDTDRKVPNNLCQQVASCANIGVHNNTHQRICNVLAWISKFDSVKSLIKELSSIPRNSQLIDYIQSNQSRFVQKDSTKNTSEKKQKNVEKYFRENFDKIFMKQSTTIAPTPVWLLKRYINATLSVKFLSIISLNHDIFKPLVEDFKFSESSTECVYTLNEYIYGMLLRNDTLKTEPVMVSRFCRREENIVVDNVQPLTRIGKLQLPTIDQLEQLSVERRRELFFKILDIEPIIFEKLEQCLIECEKDSDFVVNDEYRNQTVFQLIALIYLLQRFDGDIFLESIYAIFTNILLNGNISRGTSGQLFKLNDDQRDSVVINLVSFNQIPTFSDNSFNPTIVHYYNSFQSCFFSIEFLLQLLNLNEKLKIQVLPFSLSGTFIYKLSVVLSKQKAPFDYLKEKVLTEEFRPTKLFRDMIGLIVKISKRKLQFSGSDDEKVVPRSGIDLDLEKLPLNDDNFGKRLLIRIEENA